MHTHLPLGVEHAAVCLGRHHALWMHTIVKGGVGTQQAAACLLLREYEREQKDVCMCVCMCVIACGHPKRVEFERMRDAAHAWAKG
jgi:hypothetical protein